MADNKKDLQNSNSEDEKKGFEDNQDMNIFQEFFTFLWENKLWWMIPIAIVLALLIAIGIIHHNLFSHKKVKNS